MKRLEYKTVAMPQLLKARRRRGQSRSEMVAEIVSAVINKQAAMGWRYAGTDSFKTLERRGLLGGSQETTYTVLVFDREAQPGAPGQVEPEMHAEPRAESRTESRAEARREAQRREAAELEAQQRDAQRETAARVRAAEQRAADPRVSEPRGGESRGGEPRVGESRASEPRPAEPTASRRGAFRFGESRREPAAPRERSVERRRGDEPRQTAREPGWDDDVFDERRPAPRAAGRRPVEGPPEPDFGDYSPEEESFDTPERGERSERVRRRSYGVGGPGGRRNKS